MKTITMDFETYEKEKDDSENEGVRNAIRQFVKIAREIKDKDHREAVCILTELCTDYRMTNGDYELLREALGLPE